MKKHLYCKNQSLQHALLAELQNHAGAGAWFLPCVDHCSRQARRNAYWGWLKNSVVVSDVGLVVLLFPLTLLTLPAYVVYKLWRCRRKPPGWCIDFAKCQIQAEGLKTDNALVQLTPDMGLLAHHRVIEITHPSRGPVLTLFTATRSSDPHDHQAQTELASALAQRLQLRLVGCRVNLEIT